MSQFQPPPTYAELLLIDQKSGRTTFNPIWLNWFISLTQSVGAGGPVTSVTAASPLTSSGGGTPNITLGVIGPANFPALTGDITTAGGTLATVLKNTGTAGTYTKVTFDAKGRETSGTSAVLASADFANQGTTTTVLHGNAAGNPSFGLVNLGTDVTGSLPNTSVSGLGTMSTQNATTVAITGGTVDGTTIGATTATTVKGTTVTATTGVVTPSINTPAATNLILGSTGGAIVPTADLAQQLATAALRYSQVFSPIVDSGSGTLTQRSAGTTVVVLDSSGGGSETLSGDLLFDANGTRGIGSSNKGTKRLYADYTNTATVGNVTINKMSGRVNLGAGGTTLTLTNSLITAASHIFLNPDSAPGNVVAVLFFAVPAAGSCTINAVPAVTNQTAIDFLVVNAD